MSSRQRLQLLLLLMCTVLLGATTQKPTMQLKRNTYRYVFVFDITQSMNVIDVPPSAPSMSRLDFAKQSVQTAMTKMPCGVEIGLALFTGHRAFLMITPVEVCASYRELSTMLASIDWRMTWEARSEVAKGVFSSIKLLSALPQQTRLVFLTDGHEAPPINPDAPPQFAGERGKIRGLVVGVGGDVAVAIPKFDRNGQPDGVWQATDVMHTDTFRAAQIARDNPSAVVTGNEHLSALREQDLERLANQAGLEYHRLVNTNELIRPLTRSALGIPRTITTDVRPALATAAMLALLAAYLPASWLPKRRTSTTT